MIAHWSKLIIVLALLSAVVALSACANQPGSNAYGRNANPGSSKSSIEPYTEDYYKNRGM